MPSRTVAERFSRLGEFVELLASAGLNASTDWEERFTADLEANYERFHGDMYLSDTQLDHLERIANQ